MSETPSATLDDTVDHLHPLIGAIIHLPTGVQASVVKMLGSGGGGEAWLVRVGSSEAALKIPRDDRNGCERLTNEMRVLSRLDHPGIPRLLCCGTHGGRPYMLMDNVKGICGSSLLRHRIPFSAVVLLARQLADAVAAIHAEGIVHSDIKPQNIIIGCIPDRGPELRACLIDFGLAVAPDDDQTRLTLEGQTLGTHGFLDPGTIGSAVQRTTASDIFGLGATIGAWCVGGRLFATDDWWNIVQLRMAAQRGDADMSEAHTLIDNLVAQRLRAIADSRLRNLLQAMLRGHAAERPSADTVLETLRHITRRQEPRSTGTDLAHILGVLRQEPTLVLRAWEAICAITACTAERITMLFSPPHKPE